MILRSTRLSEKTGKPESLIGTSTILNTDRTCHSDDDRLREIKREFDTGMRSFASCNSRVRHRS